MEKEKIIQRICEAGLVAVVRAESKEQGRKITEACIAGGAAAVEITFTVPGAQDIIRELAQRYDEKEILLGAGTVLDAQTARIAILNGAQYVVSPALDVETVRLCNRYRVPVMPGVMTIRDVVASMEAGADIVKLFPGELLGPGFVKALKGPLPQAKVMPTGGVTLDNVGDWIKAGCVAVGVGGSLTAGAKTGDYASITAKAKQFVAAIAAARK
ncbi:kdpg/khg aldolase [Lucifera butyrica]|uniref:Kdpg/khg aldolase n=1 Tax=Lucifera butyrica TaxID=1351585 RepID=A0A498R2M2_9FIRM|nr:bifunctional 2-keto-4-hydroxyglutarate aldolase/2-keto-3-deoxy-6-phosphogluconate aldolase [Lucifera butyrica]VBB05067.1 kdpg/khg aldolase [Lucifera butyrica]